MGEENYESFQTSMGFAEVPLDAVGSCYCAAADSGDELAGHSGAQSADAAKQAMAFLPNEVWIDAGDSITWTSDTGESHTVTFPKQPEAPAAPGTFTGTSVTRPSFNAAGPAPFGCAGNNQGGASPNTESGLPFSGGTCVNSGPICDDTLQAVQPPAASDACAAKSFVVTFPTAGNYKLVCLIHSDMTGVIHVLASGAPYPHTPDFYSDEARDQAHDLINDSDNPREERSDYPHAAHEVIMTGELTATAGENSTWQSCATFHKRLRSQLETQWSGRTRVLTSPIP